MNCADIVRSFVDDAAASRSTPQAQEHLDRCPGCRQLVAAVSAAGPDAPVSSSAALRTIERELIRDLHPVRRIAARRYILAGFSAVFLCAVAFGVYRLGAFGLAVMSPIQSVAILCALVLSAGLLAWSLVNQMSPGSLHRLSPEVLPLTIAACLAVVIAVLFHFYGEDHFWVRIGNCLKMGTPVGLLAALPLWLLLRGGAVLSPKLTGLAAGMFAGLAGATALQIHCRNVEAAHILLSHLGLAVLASFAGFLLGLIAERLGTRRGRS